MCCRVDDTGNEPADEDDSDDEPTPGMMPGMMPGHSPERAITQQTWFSNAGCCQRFAKECFQLCCCKDLCNKQVRPKLVLISRSNLT